MCMVLAFALTLFSSSYTTVLAASINCVVGGSSICPGDHEALNIFRSQCRTTANNGNFRTGIVLAGDLVSMGAGPQLSSDQCVLPTAVTPVDCPVPLDVLEPIPEPEEFSCIGIHFDPNYRTR